MNSFNLELERALITIFKKENIEVLDSEIIFHIDPLEQDDEEDIELIYDREMEEFIFAYLFKTRDTHAVIQRLDCEYLLHSKKIKKEYKKQICYHIDLFSNLTKGFSF